MTAQVHEKITVDGEERSMAFCPDIPIDGTRVRRLTEPNLKSLAVISSACWRRYIGSWEIKYGVLWLNDIEGYFELVNGPIVADWFTGVLRVPHGKMIQYVHMGYGSVFEQEIHLKIVNGYLSKKKVIDNRGKAVDRYELEDENMPGLENRFDGDNL